MTVNELELIVIKESKVALETTINTDYRRKEFFKRIGEALLEANDTILGYFVHIYHTSDKCLHSYMTLGEGSAFIEFDREKDQAGHIFQSFVTKKCHFWRLDGPSLLVPNSSSQSQMKGVLCYPLEELDRNCFGVISLLTSHAIETGSTASSHLGIQLNTLVKNFLQNERISKLLAIEEILSDVLPSDTPIERIVEHFLESTLTVLNADVGYVTLFDKSSGFITEFHSLSINENYPNPILSSKFEENKAGIAKWVLETKSSYIYPSIQSVDSLYEPYSNIPKNSILSELIVPLVEDNYVLGLITISSIDSSAFIDEDLSFLESIGNKVTRAIQNRKFYAGSKGLSEHIFLDKTEDKICQKLSLVASEILEVPVVLVFLLKEEKNIELLKLAAHHGCEIEDYNEFNLEKGQGVCWQYVKEIRNKIKYGNQTSDWQLKSIANIQESKSDYYYSQFAVENNLISLLLAPILTEEGIITGVINIYTQTKYEFLPYEQVLLKNLCIRVSSALEMAYELSRNRELSSRIAHYQTLKPRILAANLIHDLRHTLDDLNEELDNLYGLAIKESSLKSRSLPYLKNLIKHSNYLSKIIRTIVRLGKSTKDNLKRVSIVSLVEDMFEINSYKLNENRIKFEINHDGDRSEYRAECYPNEIEQVFNNLIQNSIFAFDVKQSKDKRIVVNFLYVELGYQPYMKVEFWDNGPGISEDDIGSVFGNDFTTKGNHGSGFGLGMCKNIVEENHLGILKIDSKFGNWTQVDLYLPSFSQ